MRAYWKNATRAQRFILIIAPAMPLGWLALALIEMYCNSL